MISGVIKVINTLLSSFIADLEKASSSIRRTVVDKYPAYVLRLAGPLDAYDLCQDPAKVLYDNPALKDAENAIIVSIKKCLEQQRITMLKSPANEQTKRHYHSLDESGDCEPGTLKGQLSGLPQFKKAEKATDARSSGALIERSPAISEDNHYLDLTLYNQRGFRSRRFVTSNISAKLAVRPLFISF